MTSFLASAFDLSSRRAVCVAADKVTVYHWYQRGLADCFVFDADDAGVAHFSRYVEETAQMPVYLLVDIVEEEYRQDTIPHVAVRDRRAVIERKRARLFRNTPYFYHEVQGREADGRRDDRVLLTALTNPDLLAPWMRIFDEFRVPVAGVYSLPLLSRELLAPLEARRGQVLLVTLQAASGLRQSYFIDGRLATSRLAKMPRPGTAAFAPLILAEVERFRRYLASLRLSAREEPLQVHLLSHGETLEDLARETQDGPDVQFHVTDVARIARRLGISGALTTPYSDALHAHLLLTRRPRNQYAVGREVRFHELHRWRIGLLAASLATLVTGLVVSGYDFIAGVHVARETAHMAQRAAFYETRLASARGGLPPTVIPAPEIEIAVRVVEDLERHKATPLPALTAVGGVLRAFPAIGVDHVDWRTGRDAAMPFAGGSAAASAKATERLPGAAGPAPADLLQLTWIDGHLLDFDGDYRGAIREVRRLAEAIAAHPRVHEVRIERLPIDERPDALLSGSVDDARAPPEAPFSLRVVMGVADGRT